MTTVSVNPSLIPAIGVEVVERRAADSLLIDWGHYLGPCERPFGQQSYVLHVDGRPVSVAVSASIVSKTVRDVEGAPLSRAEVVELARLATAPDSRWATRVMLRLWREVLGPSWPYWNVTAAVAYSQSSRHDGRIYRFDGWTPVRKVAGTSGGGTWSRPRSAIDPARGPKQLWLWNYKELL